MKEKFEKYGAQFALIVVAAIWGWTFTVVGDAIALYPMYGFLFWRFMLASVVLAVIFPKTLTRFTLRDVGFGAFAGIFLALGYILQTWALDGVTATTPARCAFLTGLYVVMVPFVQAVIMRKKPQIPTVVGVVAAIAGMVVLSGVLSQGGHSWVFGDTLGLACAFAYTAHMLLLGFYGRKHNTMVITLVQLIVCALMCGVIAFFKEGITIPTDPHVIWAIVICAVLASAFANFIQNWAQKIIAPSRVALILVSEPAFGGIFGWTLSGVAPLYEVAGAALMLGGMVYSEVMASRRPSSEVELEEAVEGIPVFEEKGD